MINTGNNEAGPELSRRELLQMVIPGRSMLSPIRVEIERDSCTGCALCARDCPNQAITVSGAESMTIAFQTELCDGCGLCVRTCPENCLHLEEGDGRDESGPAKLFEDEFEHCESCGVVIGSRAMVRLIRSKLETRDPALAARTGLCPVCKGKKDGYGV
jgi:ferredoxin